MIASVPSFGLIPAGRSLTVRESNSGCDDCGVGLRNFLRSRILRDHFALPEMIDSVVKKETSE